MYVKSARVNNFYRGAQKLQRFKVENFHKKIIKNTYMNWCIHREMRFIGVTEFSDNRIRSVTPTILQYI